MNEKIRQEADNIDWNSSKDVISFYESNQLYFDNFSIQNSIDSILEITEIKITYILSLDNKNHFDKAKRCLDQVDILVNKLENSDYFDQINEKYLFAAGVISNRLKKVEESQDYFKRLIRIDPENNLYQSWYEGNKDILFAKKTKLLGYIGFGLFMTALFADLIINIDEKLQQRLEIFSIVIMIIGFYGYAIKRFIKKHILIKK